jgi:hypothetical protein
MANLHHDWSVGCGAMSQIRDDHTAVPNFLYHYLAGQGGE